MPVTQTPCDTCGAAKDGRCYVEAPQQPITQEFIADGVWINQVQISGVGIALPQHAHRFEHATVISEGGVRVEREDAPAVELWSPQVINIPANVKHLFVTLSDRVVLLCIHRIDRSGAVEVAEEHQIVR
jgi:quercetin dioxygenase-like cupin family protein